MAPLLKLLQESPVELAFCAFALLLTSSLAAHLLIYIGLRILGVPSESARSMLISFRRCREPAPEPRPIPLPLIARANPARRSERSVA